MDGWMVESICSELLVGLLAPKCFNISKKLWNTPPFLLMSEFGEMLVPGWSARGFDCFYGFGESSDRGYFGGLVLVFVSET
jgi:hypothetical protein